MKMIYELWSKSTAGFFFFLSANDFISSKSLKLQNKKTTLLNNIYHLLKPKQENSTPEALQKLKVFLYKAHQQSLEKDIVPAYYSTSTFLKDYIYTHLPYKVGMNEGNYLSVYKYVHGILDYISTHEHELKQWLIIKDEKNIYKRKRGRSLFFMFNYLILLFDLNDGLLLIISFISSIDFWILSFALIWWTL